MSKYIIIDIDSLCESPREWENLGTMVCFHNRYALGDKDHGYSKDEIISILNGENSDYISLHLYLYDHSGITMNTTGFDCPWDSMFVGAILVSKEKVRKEYGWKVITKKRRELIESYLKNEVETYDQYLTDDVYSFTCIDNDEITDSCGGFFGSDPETNGMLEHIGEEFYKSARIIRKYLGEGIS